MNPCNICYRAFLTSTLTKYDGMCGACFAVSPNKSSQCNINITTETMKKYGLCRSCMFPLLEKEVESLKQENKKPSRLYFGITFKSRSW